MTTASEHPTASANRDRITIALAGNPNSGKTTLFNALTGARQHVGNYPGVTVERKEGSFRQNGRPVHVVDLPGTYSLDAHTAEEVVAQNFLLDEAPDVVIDVLDASNLERNLYLATQLLEINVPLVLAMNMSDVAAAAGIELNVPELSALLGVPIVKTVGHRGEGLEELVEAALQCADHRRNALERKRHCDYGHEIEPHVKQLALSVSAACPVGDVPPRWMALKLLEGEDDSAMRRLDRNADPDSAKSLRGEADRLNQHLRTIFGESPEVLLAERRYGFISGACSESTLSNVHRRHELSDRIDAVLTHRWLGLPVFAGLMFLTFYLAFAVAEIPMQWLEVGMEWLGRTVASFWPKQSDSLLRDLLVDGIIGGVGGVIVFLPNIMVLFLAIAFLEDTGYMARAAFIIDHVMHRLGLHGKSFIPMLIGFGCSVPAILATRTLETRRDRLTTMLIVPLMSCGARFPIYALIIPAFFPPGWRAPVLWGIYMIGIVLAILCAKLLRVTVLRGETTPFVMELPPYRMPTATGLGIHMWERAWEYVKKAGTIILAASVILWALSTFPRTEPTRPYDELVGRARQEYIAQADELSTRLDLPADANATRQLLRAQAQWDRAQQTWWPREPEYARAREEYRKEWSAALSGQAGQKLGDMLTLAEKISAAREEFRQRVEQKEWTPQDEGYQLARLQRNVRLRELREENVGLYEAAAFYLEDMQARLTERVHALRYQQRAEQARYSAAGWLGRTLEPVLRPLGFDWRINTALIGAFAAKEVFVAQLGIVYAVGEADSQSSSLRSQLRDRYTSLQGFCVMLFCLISMPCVATVAATRKESGRWSWALLQLGGLTVLAYIVTMVVYQVGRLVG
ncbi:MAG: ferrous iron transport protein B [Phycisphaerae bacterium]